MTLEYEACLKTVPFRKGDVWWYETSIRIEPSNPVKVLIESVDFGVSENGTMCHMFGRFLNEGGQPVSAPIMLHSFNMKRKVEAEEVAA